MFEIRALIINTQAWKNVAILLVIKFLGVDILLTPYFGQRFRDLEPAFYARYLFLERKTLCPVIPTDGFSFLEVFLPQIH